jgi:cell division protease FtsH
MLKDNPSNPGNDKGPKQPDEIRAPSPRNWIVLVIILLFIPLLYLIRSQSDQKQLTLTYNQFMEKVGRGDIIEGLIRYDPQYNTLREVAGRYVVRDEKGEIAKTAEGKPQESTFQIEIPLTPELEQTLLQQGLKTAKPNTVLLNVIVGLLPFLLLIALIYFFFVRQIRMAGKGAMSFGKSKARMLTKDKNKTTFKDVAGVEEAEEEVSELVDFLKDPRKFQRLGGRIPKGILMVGPPGTGKTLLAKAIAGEADASFFNISGSDFVEMFVGVGASRVRDMFEQARKNTPCLIFIDEIDAVGRSRGHGLGGGNDEREQTLNALLVEMDGFDSQEGIIIIAATNRPDVLDPALLRPGRFDRQIMVNLPDVKGREEILKVHAKKVKLHKDVDLSVIARGTPGFSGAELANLLNEAALLAARSGKKSINMPELEEARIKVRWGRERRSLAMTDEEKKFTAWHEAGHALVNVSLEHTHPLHKVTIIPRGQALGVTMSLPKHDTYSTQKKAMKDLIAMAMAGRIAEEISSGDISTGASGDIKQATQLARSMVCNWGMSDDLGMVLYGEEDGYVFLGKEMGRNNRSYSEQTAQRIDAEVKKIIDEGYNIAADIIQSNRDKLQMIAEALLEHETLDGSQVEDIVKKGSFTPNENNNIDPPSGAEAVTPTEEPPRKTPPKLDGADGLGSPAPAPI